MDVIQVKIKLTSNAQVYTISVSKSDTIFQLKEKLQGLTQIPPLSQNLVYKGRILANENLISDYNIENDHTIILVKKHTTAPQTQNTSQQNLNTSHNTSNTNSIPSTNANSNSNTNVNNNLGNNSNPFMGGIPDLSSFGSLLGNIDPNELNNMMQNMGGLGGLGGLGGMSGINPQMMGQLLSNPMYMQMMQNMLQNPEMIQMALNSPQMQQFAQNNPQMQVLLNNPQLIQQMLSPQNLQTISNMFTGMSNQQNQNPNNSSGAGNNQNQSGFDLAQMQQLLQNIGGLQGLEGLGGLGNANNLGGPGNLGNLGNMGTGENNPNVDYKEKYKEQLAKLKEMGFINEETNLQILKQCSGNVQFAVERLMNMLG